MHIIYGRKKCICIDENKKCRTDVSKKNENIYITTVRDPLPYIPILLLNGKGSSYGCGVDRYPFFLTGQF